MRRPSPPFTLFILFSCSAVHCSALIACPAFYLSGAFALLSYGGSSDVFDHDLCLIPGTRPAAPPGRPKKPVGQFCPTHSDPLAISIAPARNDYSVGQFHTRRENHTGIMSGALSKRQQARNEKFLHELVQSVRGNNKCADCHAPNPGEHPSALYDRDPRLWLTITLSLWNSLGFMECTNTLSLRQPDPYWPSTPLAKRLRCTVHQTILTLNAVGCFPVYAMRFNSSQVGHTYFQSQVTKHG